MAVQQIHQIHLDTKEEILQKLFDVPSAVTPAERQLAMHFVATQWDGTGDVFENGPLLGSITRALGMGMLFNERREEDSQLHTYDWWSIREPLDLSEEVWGHLVEREMLKQSEVDDAFAIGTFLPLYEAIHRNETYWPLVRPHVGYLPGHRGDVSPYGEPNFETPDREFAVCFIDGCKSWYGTKHWFREIAPRLLPQADFLLQDYGHYTCFWIPMLVGMFRDRFELLAYVDYTYVWRLRNPPTEAEVELAFPDEPTDVPRETYERIFGGLLREAESIGDRREVLLLQMQLAAAYAYLGLLDESRHILDELLMQAEWLPLRAYLKQARHSPTYTPEGPIYL